LGKVETRLRRRHRSLSHNQMDCCFYFPSKSFTENYRRRFGGNSGRERRTHEHTGGPISVVPWRIDAKSTPVNLVRRRAPCHYKARVINRTHAVPRRGPHTPRGRNRRFAIHLNSPVVAHFTAEPEAEMTSPTGGARRPCRRHVIVVGGVVAGGDDDVTRR